MCKSVSFSGRHDLDDKGDLRMNKAEYTELEMDAVIIEEEDVIVNYCPTDTNKGGCTGEQRA